MDLSAQVQRVISQFDLPPVQRIEFLRSAGGFSGAQLWKLTAGKNTFCIRRWPKSHPSQERLNWIHSVLVHAHQNGCPFVAAPIVSRAGETTIVRIDDALWEISPWMPGKADFLHNSNDQRLGNMARALASFHLASAQINLDFNRSSNVNSRVEQLANVDQTISNVQRAPANSGDQTFEDFRQTVSACVGPLASALQSKLSRFTDTVFSVQPVIRDVWHDHVFFTGDQVTGLVDFGAMQIDNVILDLARLLGSTVRDDRTQWHFAVQSYREIRPLSDTENELLPLLDESGIILGSLNWLKWICLEGRQFENWEEVKKRVEFLAARLQRLAVS